MTIMYSKEDILFKALRVQTSREQEYCQKVRPIVLEKIRRMPNSTISMEQLKRVWYGGRDGSQNHYDSTRYYALYLYTCSPKELWSGDVLTNNTLSCRKSAGKYYPGSCYFRPGHQSNAPRCGKRRSQRIRHLPSVPFYCGWGSLARNIKVREHLLANLEGDRAWRYDRSTYECLNRNHRAEDAR